MATSAASGQLFNTPGYVVNSRRTNLKSLSVNDILFMNSGLKTKEKAHKVD